MCAACVPLELRTKKSSHNYGRRYVGFLCVLNTSAQLLYNLILVYIYSLGWILKRISDGKPSSLKNG